MLYIYIYISWDTNGNARLSRLMHMGVLEITQNSNWSRMEAANHYPKPETLTGCNSQQALDCSTGPETPLNLSAPETDFDTQPIELTIVKIHHIAKK